jgi:hypothetical protein
LRKLIGSVSKNQGNHLPAKPAINVKIAIGSDDSAITVLFGKPNQAGVSEPAKPSLAKSLEILASITGNVTRGILDYSANVLHAVMNAGRLAAILTLENRLTHNLRLCLAQAFGFILQPAVSA